MRKFTFHREDTKTTEEVPLEKWAWKVRYSDDTELFQFDEATGLFHQFKEIDLTKPFVFQVYDCAGEKQPITILYNPDTMKLFYFYRNGILENLTRRVRLIVFGYQTGRRKNHFVIMPTGELVITDDDNLIHF